MRLFVLAIALFGCVGEITVEGDPTDVPPPENPPPEPPPPPPAPQFACRNQVTTALPSGEHHPGEDCMGNCHNHGFSIAGTLVTSTGTPYVGGVITAVDSTGKALDVTSYQNGNFYTKSPVAFPVKVFASACPDVRPMITEVKSVDAGCNRGGCHVTGATGPVKL